MPDRRNFIKQTTFAGMLVCCGISLDSCSNIKYIYLSGDISKLSVNKKNFSENKFVILKHGKLPAPVYLVKKNENEYKALLMLCTHKGCEVRPTGNFLLCPCHGSEFSNEGKVAKSPATENLKEFKTSSDQTFVYVEIN